MIKLNRKGRGKMKKEKSTQIAVIAVLSVAILIMSVGFAVFTEILDFSGTTKLAASSWGIAFDTGSYSETSGSVSVAADKRTLTGTSMSFNVNLAKPGDFYEFTVNVNNSGTFNTNMTDIMMSTLNAAQQKYLSYTIYYGGESYTATADSLTHALNAGATAPVKVRVEYLHPEDPDDLPSEEVTVNLTASLTYKQV